MCLVAAGVPAKPWVMLEGGTHSGWSTGDVRLLSSKPHGCVLCSHEKYWCPKEVALWDLDTEGILPGAEAAFGCSQSM
jgi:hypothetical protein